MSGDKELNEGGEEAKLLSGLTLSRLRGANALTPRWKLAWDAGGATGLRCGIGRGSDRKIQERLGLGRSCGDFSAMVRILFFNWVKWKATGGFTQSIGLTWFKF